MYIEKILKEYLNKECDNEYVYKKLMGLRYENLDDKELSVIINILIKLQILNIQMKYYLLQKI